ncbi:hypothetical protein OEB96_06705 [Paraliomyxa miuraensis]|nr:hypothetical protein [Paraliomyxa miuraensis]
MGARVVLVGAEHAPEWLNTHRPVVWERELVLLLWVKDEALELLRRNAPDFLDWVSHRIEVPWFAPEDAMSELRLALTRVKWIAVAGVELVAFAAEGRTEIEASRPYDELVSAMDGGDVLVRGLEHDDQLWRLLIAHAELRWRNRIVLAEPCVLPPLSWVIDARIGDWKEHAHRLDSLGVEHARLIAALTGRGEGVVPLARGLSIDEVHMELLGRVSREQLDGATVACAHDLGLHDVAEALDLRTWSADQITSERIERCLFGGLRSRRALARYVMGVVSRGIVDEQRKHGDEVRRMWPEAVDLALDALFRDDGRALRAWDPATDPSFEHYVALLTRPIIVRNEERGP